ncbi:hypothetical protein AB0P21_27550 [Kribbella sp. NPDC056861]|uniref:hypothetical protein n=1 Tax=Kribbella sp. NPDC056861 TaxID=3154857 RepID=UPI00342DFA35
MSTTEWRQPANGKISPPRVGAVGYFVLSLVCLVLAVSGPALVVALIVLDADFPWWAMLLTVVVAVFLVFFAFTLWRTYHHGRRDTKLIEASGLPATAEILSVGTTSWGEGEGVRLGLRISGPGFETFEAPFEWKHTDHFEVGGRLAVLVEPTARLYLVRP